MNSRPSQLTINWPIFNLAMDFGFTGLIDGRPVGLGDLPREIIICIIEAEQYDLPDMSGWGPQCDSIVIAKLRKTSHQFDWLTEWERAIAYGGSEAGEIHLRFDNALRGDEYYVVRVTKDDETADKIITAITATQLHIELRCEKDSDARQSCYIINGREYWANFAIEMLDDKVAQKYLNGETARVIWPVAHMRHNPPRRHIICFSRLMDFQPLNTHIMWRSR